MTMQSPGAAVVEHCASLGRWLVGTEPPPEELEEPPDDPPEPPLEEPEPPLLDPLLEPELPPLLLLDPSAPASRLVAVTPPQAQCDERATITSKLRRIQTSAGTWSNGRTTPMRREERRTPRILSTGRASLRHG